LLRYRFLLIIGSSLLAVSLLLSQAAKARTPPDPAKGVPKPANFPTRLPWETGESHRIGWAYGVCNPSNYAKGDHCNFTGGPKDYYALDFDLSSTNDVVYPIAGGTLLYAGPAMGNWSSYGNVVYLDHNIDGTHYQSLYAHLSDIDVSRNQSIDANTPLGTAGDSGTPGLIHLHFALYQESLFCYPESNCLNGVGPYGGRAVVPESLVGSEVYEGFGLQWYDHPGWFGPLRADNVQNDINDIVPPVGQWISGSATENGSEVGRNQQVHFAVWGLPSDTKEVRFTAFYNADPNAENYGDWSKMGDPVDQKVWRILARCWPNADNPGQGCQWSGNYSMLFFEWRPHQDDFHEVAPWLPSGKGYVNPPYHSNDKLAVCISFDVFDQAGNVTYAPAGTQCGIQTNPATTFLRSSELADTEDSAARLIYILPPTSETVDSATFIRDVTVPDGTVFSAGQPFVKTWRLRNTGTSTWGPGYQLVFMGGNRMGAPDSVDLSRNVAPGEEVGISVNMTTSSANGTYQANWQMRNPQGVFFGEPVWVVIVVPPPAPPTIDDVELVSCSFSPTTLTSGQTLKVDFKVTNHGDNTVSTQGPDPGHVYQEGQSADTIGHPDIPGRWRVAVEYGDRPKTIKDHPYRWGLGSDLAPGKTRTVSGYIALNTIKRTDYWCALIHEQIGGGEDFVDTTTITVQEPDRTGPTITSYHFEPSSPSNTGVVQVCAEAQDNPGGVGVDHIGVCIDGCQFNDSIWGAGGCKPWESGHPTYTPGVHDVELLPVDKNGNWGPSVRTCYTIGDRDISPPRVKNITFNPPSGSPESGTTDNVHIRVEWEDPCGESGIQSTTVFATDCTFGRPPLGSRQGSPAEFDWYVGCLPLGNYEIDVYMQDHQGNANSEFFRYQRGVDDEQPPTGSIVINPTPRDSWTVEYTADALPLNSTPRWERSESMGYESIENGVLRSRAPDPSHYNYYRQAANLSNETGTTLEARLKLVSGQPLNTGAIGNNISIFDNARKTRLVIFPDGIKLADCAVCDEYPMDTTDDFHIYRLTLQGNTAKAYVDGVLRLSGTAVANSDRNEIWFGNDFMGAPDEGLWDYVRYYTGGALPPPWTVEYTADRLPSDSTPSWVRWNSLGYESVANGILRSGTHDNQHYNYYRQAATLSNETGTTLEARLKVIDGQLLATGEIGNNISIFDDARKIRLAIFPDGIKLADCEVCDEYRMITNDDFHVYRLTLQGNTAKAYVDGVLRLSGTAITNTDRVEIWFGNDWMGGPDEGLWDYVRYYTGGAITPSADVTDNPDIVLALAAKDAGWGLSQMNIGVCNSDEEQCELLGWEPFVPKKTITLPPGDGLKYVKVQYSDRAGNRSDWYYDTIILDTTAPTSTVSALPTMQTASSFAVGWSGTDSPIDVTKFDVQYKDVTSSMLLEGETNSAWTDWYTNTTLSSALFTGEYGHTYYFQTRAKDIAGNVEEYPVGDGDAYTEICFLPPDAYETDDTPASATLIATNGITQTHNIHVAGDEDWFRFAATGGVTYTIQTGDLAPGADTYLYLYDTDGATLLASNDDYGGSLTSQIDWQAPADGTYYLMVKHWNPNVGGCETNYSVAVRPKLLGDLDGNCVVNTADIQMVAARWRQSAGPPYDFDGDSRVTIVDIMKVAAHWGESCGMVTSTSE